MESVEESVHMGNRNAVSGQTSCSDSICLLFLHPLSSASTFLRFTSNVCLYCYCVIQLVHTLIQPFLEGGIPHSAFLLKMSPLIISIFSLVFAGLGGFRNDMACKHFGTVLPAIHVT